MERLFKIIAVVLSCTLAVLIISLAIRLYETQKNGQNQKDFQSQLLQNTNIEACIRQWRDRYAREEEAILVPAAEPLDYWVMSCGFGHPFNESDFISWYNSSAPRNQYIVECKQRWTAAITQERRERGNLYTPVDGKSQKEFGLLCLDGIEYQDQKKEDSGQECLESWIAEYRKHSGEDSAIRWDVIKEWEHWCELGRTPLNFAPESQPTKTAAELEEEDRCIALWKDSFIKEFGADEYIYIDTEVEWRQSCERGENP